MYTTTYGGRMLNAAPEPVLPMVIACVCAPAAAIATECVCAPADAMLSQCECSPAHEVLKLCEWLPSVDVLNKGLSLSMPPPAAYKP